MNTAKLTAYGITVSDYAVCPHRPGTPVGKTKRMEAMIAVKRVEKKMIAILGMSECREFFVCMEVRLFLHACCCYSTSAGFP